MFKRTMLATGLSLTMLAGCGGESPKPPASTARGSGAATAPAKEADRKAEALLKEAYALLDQKKAAEAEQVLTKVVEMKAQLSTNMKEQAKAAITGLGFLNPQAAMKLGPQLGD